MYATGAPVIIDATHSVQMPGGATTGGQRTMVPVIARSAVAAGCHGVFMETHPDPDKAMSDGPNQVKLEDMPRIFNELKRLRSLILELDEANAGLIPGASHCSIWPRLVRFADPCQVKCCRHPVRISDQTTRSTRVSEAELLYIELEVVSLHVVFEQSPDSTRQSVSVVSSTYSIRWV